MKRSCSLSYNILIKIDDIVMIKLRIIKYGNKKIETEIKIKKKHYIY